MSLGAASRAPVARVTLSNPATMGWVRLRLQQMDPLGVGPSQVALNYFHTYPLPNDYSTGNIVNYRRLPLCRPDADKRQLVHWPAGLQVDPKRQPHAFPARCGQKRSPRPVYPSFQVRGRKTQRSTVSKGFVAGYTSVIGPA